jgi:hypothetical protein
MPRRANSEVMVDQPPAGRPRRSARPAQVPSVQAERHSVSYVEHARARRLRAGSASGLTTLSHSTSATDTSRPSSAGMGRIRIVIVLTRVESSRAKGTKGNRSPLSTRFGTVNNSGAARRAPPLELPKPAVSMTRLAAAIALTLRMARKYGIDGAPPPMAKIAAERDRSPQPNVLSCGMPNRLAAIVCAAKVRLATWVAAAKARLEAELRRRRRSFRKRRPWRP